MLLMKLNQASHLQFSADQKIKSFVTGYTSGITQIKSLRRAELKVSEAWGYLVVRGLFCPCQLKTI